MIKLHKQLDIYRHKDKIHKKGTDLAVVKIIEINIIVTYMYTQSYSLRPDSTRFL